MNRWDIIKNFKNKDFLLSLWGVFFLILPGIAATFIFAQDMFFKLSWITLILLSGAMAFPFVVFNTFVIMTLENVRPRDKDGFFYNFLMSSFVTGLVIYIGIAVGYYFNYSLEFLLKVAVGFEVTLFVAFSVFDAIRERRKKQQKK